MNVGAGKPPQVPFVAVSSWPWTVEPEIVGATVFTGAPVTTAVGPEVAATDDPTPLLAVTTTLSVFVRSSVTGV